MTLSPRERVMTTLRRETLDQAPRDIDLTPLLFETSKEKPGRIIGMTIST